MRRIGHQQQVRVPSPWEWGIGEISTDFRVFYPPGADLIEVARAMRDTLIALLQDVNADFPDE